MVRKTPKNLVSRLLSALLQDLRYALRTLSKRPAVAFVAIVALAPGIGANTAIFSVVNAVLLRSLPYRNPEDLVLARSFEKAKGAKMEMVSYQDFQDWKAQNRVFEDVATFAPRGGSLVAGDDIKQINAAQVSANFFQLIGVNAFRGRTFLPEEEKPGGAKVALLGHALWQKVFGADEGLIGRQVKLNDQSFTVVGILPPDFKFPFALEKAEIWTSNANLSAEMTSNRGIRNLRVIARLKPGVSLEAAQAEMTGIAGHIERENPGTNRDLGVSLIRVHDELTKEVHDALWSLFGAVIFVLLIACSNVADLLLAQAISRRKEIAIRAALGASARRIARQSLTESLLLSLTGGAIGLLIAACGVRLFLALSPQNLPRINSIGIDGQVLAYTLALSLLTAIFFGLAPALKATQPDLNEALKGIGKVSATGAGRSRLRGALIIGEIAIAFILLIGAGLLVNSFIRLNRVDIGFKPENILTAGLYLAPNKYPKGDNRVAFLQQARESIKSLPGVRSVGFTSSFPFSGYSFASSFQIVGREWPANENAPTVKVFTITHDYFAMMGVQLLKGRPFIEADDKKNKGVAIINEAFARRFLPNENPLGQIVTQYLNRDADSPAEFEIIGVIGDVRGVGLDKEPTPEIYTPYHQTPWSLGQLVIRTDAHPLSLVDAVRRRIKDLDAEMTLNDLNTVENLIADSVAPQRFNLALLSVFAAIGLVLTLVGVYGVMSYFVTENTREIGVRIVLGAQRADVMKFALGRGVLLASLGVVIGAAGAFGLTRLMASLLYGVTATDPLTFTAVAVSLAMAALLACYIPARRAANVDPIVVLRHE